MRLLALQIASTGLLHLWLKLALLDLALSRSSWDHYHLAPSTMAGIKQKIKTDKRDAERITSVWRMVHISQFTFLHGRRKCELIRMRDDHVAFKKVKQQINAFCCAEQSCRRPQQMDDAPAGLILNCKLNRGFGIPCFLSSCGEQLEALTHRRAGCRDRCRDLGEAVICYIV